MSQQHSKVVKRARRKRYLERVRARIRAARQKRACVIAARCYHSERAWLGWVFVFAAFKMLKKRMASRKEGG